MAQKTRAFCQGCLVKEKKKKQGMHHTIAKDFPVHSSTYSLLAFYSILPAAEEIDKIPCFLCLT
jgi:hypothetical protein